MVLNEVAEQYLPSIESVHQRKLQGDEMGVLKTQSPAQMIQVDDPTKGIRMNALESADGEYPGQVVDVYA